ncbi:hypothetical protein H0H87_011605, partial [Tephrocybe sp. NHM501043]
MDKLHIRHEGNDKTDSELENVMDGLGLHNDDKRLLPCLAARIDLTFESNRDEAVFLEGLLVASSMRTVYSVPKHRQYLRGGYSSEPFVAEAAARVIFQRIRGLQDRITTLVNVRNAYKTAFPTALEHYLISGLISKGTRGELVARTLLTLAHDCHYLENVFPNETVDPSTEKTLSPAVSFNHAIPVIDYLKALIPEYYRDTVLQSTPQNMQGKTLEEAFRGAV